MKMKSALPSSPSDEQSARLYLIAGWTGPTGVGLRPGGGRMGGQVMVAHALAVDAKGNVYVGETIENNRVQRFKFVGMRTP